MIVERCVADGAYGLHSEPGLDAFPMKDVLAARVPSGSGPNFPFVDLVQTYSTHEAVGVEKNVPRDASCISPQCLLSKSSS